MKSADWVRSAAKQLAADAEETGKLAKAAAQLRALLDLIEQAPDVPEQPCVMFMQAQVGELRLALAEVQLPLLVLIDTIRPIAAYLMTVLETELEDVELPEDAAMIINKVPAPN